MKKIVITFLFILTSIMFVSPINTSALSIDSISKTTLDNIYLLEKTTTDDANDILDDYNKEQDCTGSNSIFGDPTDENSVAWLITEIMNYIKIIGPILVIIISAIDFIKVIIKSDDETMSKAQKKLIMRLILALLLFLIPTIVNALLALFGISSCTTTGL